MPSCLVHEQRIMIPLLRTSNDLERKLLGIEPYARGNREEG